MPALLTARNLHCTVGTRVLFDALTFGIHSGDRIGLIGPNGAGKSTLLKILSGEREADGGELIAGKGLRIAMLEQDPVLDPDKGMVDTIGEGAPESPALWQEMFRKVGLDALGVSPDTPLSQLSGGWQKRVALGRALARRPDVLLLDEPTNHLDMESILWMERFLARAEYAVLTITHDRQFLQNVSNRVFELNPRYSNGLFTIDGDYATFLEKRDEHLEAEKSREASLKNRLRRETEWLRQGAKARTTKQKARIQAAAALQEQTEDLSSRNQAQQVRMRFTDSERKTKRLIEATDIAKTLGGKSLFSEVSLFLGPGVRLGLIGKNGCGKSTLIRVLLGEMAPDEGNVQRADGLRVAYFSQNRDALDPERTLLKTLCPSGEQVSLQGRPLHIRSYLQRFLFAPEQGDTPIKKLSGGEQARVLVAQLMLQPADVLVLDEPTNDLDIPTLDVLEDCLTEFKGAVILVTHDRYFLDRVTNCLLGFTRKPGQVLAFADLAQWEAHREEAAAPKRQAKAPDRPKKKTKLSYKEARELAGIEDRIHEAERKVAELTARAEAPENATSPGKLQELYQGIAEAQAEVDRLFDRWQELEALQQSLGKTRP